MPGPYELLLLPFIEYGFMRRALVACFGLAIGCGPIGVFLILRRMSLVGDAMSHAVLPGAAIAFLMFGFSLTAMTIGGFLVGLKKVNKMLKEENDKLKVQIMEMEAQTIAGTAGSSPALAQSCAPRRRAQAPGRQPPAAAPRRRAQEPQAHVPCRT